MRPPSSLVPHKESRKMHGRRKQKSEQMRSTFLKCTLDPIRGCNGRAHEFRKATVEVAVPSSQGEVTVAEKMERGWVDLGYVFKVGLANVADG